VEAGAGIHTQSPVALGEGVALGSACPPAADRLFGAPLLEAGQIIGENLCNLWLLLGRAMNKAELKPDRFWKKSRIAARILLKKRRGQLTPRDIRLAQKLADDPEVSNRLIAQGLRWLKGPNHDH
jgi:hypothetical protein